MIIKLTELKMNELSKLFSIFILLSMSYAKEILHSAHGNSASFIEFYTDPASVIRVYLRPCEEINMGNILLESTDLPRHTQNPYFVFVNNYFDSGSEMEVTFSSPSTIYFDDRFNAFIRPISNLTIAMRFFKTTTMLTFLIEKSKSALVPYVAGLRINGVELCKSRTMATKLADGEYFVSNDYMQQYKEFEYITLPIYNNVCGKRKLLHTGLIVNGSPTKPGDWPWHAAIYLITNEITKYHGGGTLISKYHVLTAAHCVTRYGFPYSPEVMSVVLGKHSLRSGDITAVEKEVLDIIVHENFNPRELSNDIALIKLSTKVVYTNYIRPACLWQSALNSKLPKHVYGTVVGWGFDHTEKLSKQLKQVEIPMVKESTCLMSNRAFFGQRLNEKNFCAGYLNGTSACNGDSGGGFTISIEDRYYVRGIVSSAIAKPITSTCDPNNYVLFTDVEKYTSWIHSNTHILGNHVTPTVV